MGFQKTPNLLWGNQIVLLIVALFVVYLILGLLHWDANLLEIERIYWDAFGDFDFDVLVRRWAAVGAGLIELQRALGSGHGLLERDEDVGFNIGARLGAGRLLAATESSKTSKPS